MWSRSNINRLYGIAYGVRLYVGVDISGTTLTMYRIFQLSDKVVAPCTGNSRQHKSLLMLVVIVA